MARAWRFSASSFNFCIFAAAVAVVVVVAAARACEHSARDVWDAMNARGVRRRDGRRAGAWDSDARTGVLPQLHTRARSGARGFRRDCARTSRGMVDSTTA